MTDRAPLLRTDLSHGFRDRDAKCGEAVQDGDTDLELGDLTVELARGETLAQERDGRRILVSARLRR